MPAGGGFVRLSMTLAGSIVNLDKKISYTPPMY